MRAWVSVAPGGSETLVLQDKPTPIAGPGEILVKVAACGLNFSDLLLMRDQYQVKLDRPFTPGSEVAGIVVSLGPGVNGFRVGQRVIALSDCGGVAEFARASAENCTPAPAQFDRVTAAASLFSYQTAYYALVARGHLKRSDTVLVLGAAGGVGTAAVQIAKALGSRVIVGVSSASKLAFALANGGDAGFIYSPVPGADAKRALRSALEALAESGVDIVVDPVGGSIAQVAMRQTRVLGRYLVLGFTGGIPSIPLNIPLLNSCDILGVNVRTFALNQPAQNDANRRALLELLPVEQMRRSVTGVFPFEHTPLAFKGIEDRSAHGKIVVKIGDGRGF